VRVKRKQCLIIVKSMDKKKCLDAVSYDTRTSALSTRRRFAAGSSVLTLSSPKISMISSAGSVSCAIGGGEEIRRGATAACSPLIMGDAVRDGTTPGSEATGWFAAPVVGVVDADDGGLRMDSGAVVKGPVAGAALDFLGAEPVGLSPLPPASVRFDDLDFFFPFPFVPSVLIFTFKKRTI